MKNTKIEWADHTFNPWIGCTKISPACDNCYAAVSTPARTKSIQWGAGQPRVRTSAQNWKQPRQWNKQAGILQHAWEHGIALHGGDEALCLANGFLKPQRPRVFCASLADVFDNQVPDDWRTDLFNLISSTPNLDWLLLTKRVGNVGNMLPVPFDFDKHYPNVWLGATICNQEEADRDIKKLLTVPAAKRFLSIEPMLGAIDLTDLSTATGEQWNALKCAPHDIPCTTIDWVIVGGESGRNARPLHPKWVRSLRNQCNTAGVPFFFKQWGEWIAASQADCPVEPPLSRAQWADGAEFKPGDGQRGQELFCRVGKKAAGRLFDGYEHNYLPI